MKKLILLILLLSFSVIVFAAEDVTNTKHNLSTTASTATRTYKLTSGTDEICVFCHTPHGASAKAPLWNRNDSTQTFTMYSSSTLDMTIAAAPLGVSAACLSCHDGATAFDSLINGPGSGTAVPTGWVWTPTNILNAGIANLGTDLSNDHPISVTYDNTKDTAFNADTDGKVGTLPLYDSVTSGTFKEVECGTCHNPHEKDLGNFLRISNAASAMCLTCHKK